MGDSYDANPPELQRSISRLEGISEETKQYQRDFRDDTNEHTGWWRNYDEYGLKASEQWRTTNASYLESCGLIFGGIQAVITAKLGELRQVVAPQENALEDIAKAKAKTENIGNGSGGKH